MHFATMIFKLNLIQNPKYLFDKLIQPSHEHNTRIKNSLVVPIRKTVQFEGSFSCMAPKVWNDLPERIRSLGSMRDFRNNLKDHLCKKKSKCNNLCVYFGHFI